MEEGGRRENNSNIKAHRKHLNLKKKRAMEEAMSHTYTNC